MTSYKNKYLSPIVDYISVSSVNCLCISETNNPDIYYSDTGANDSGQTTPF